MGISAQHGCACEPGTLGSARGVKRVGRSDDAGTDWPCPREMTWTCTQWGCPLHPLHPLHPLRGDDHQSQGQTGLALRPVLALILGTSGTWRIPMRRVQCEMMSIGAFLGVYLNLNNLVNVNHSVTFDHDAKVQCLSYQQKFSKLNPIRPSTQETERLLDSLYSPFAIVFPVPSSALFSKLAIQNCSCQRNTELVAPPPNQPYT